MEMSGRVCAKYIICCLMSLMVSADVGLSGINAAQVLRSVGGERGTLDELFPSTDVAITLEKKIPSASVPTQSLQTGLEEIGETADSTSFRSGHRTEAYEDLEDPFAPKEEIPDRKSTRLNSSH